MKKKSLFALWGVLFLVCAGLGFIPEPSGAVRWLLTVLSILFFLPPAVLVYQGRKTGDAHLLALIRNLSALSLGLTALLLIMNFLTAFRSELLGNILHAVLVVVSSPMICSGRWVLSLFLWACLLMSSLSVKQKTK